MRPKQGGGTMQIDTVWKATRVAAKHLVGAVHLAALPLALLGLPLPPDGPIHHRFLAYVVVAIVIATPIVRGQIPAGKARNLLLAVATTIAFVLYLGAFNTLIASIDAVLQFIAAPLGLQVQTLRVILVVLFAVFVLLLSWIWHEPLGATWASPMPAGPQGGAFQSNPEAGPGMQQSAHIGPSSRPTPGKASNPGRARGPTGRKDRGEPEKSHQGVAFDSDATLATSAVSPVPTTANGSRLARAGSSRIVRCALPVVAFILVCASPVGNFQTCHLAAEQTLLAAAAAERTWPMPAFPLEGKPKTLGDAPNTPPPPRADAEKRNGPKRTDGRPRVPPDPTVNRAR